jgi:hypothetical protein
MISKRPSELLDLERDLPTTPEDVRALRENRPKAGDDWLEQLQSLADQFPLSEEARRRRRTFAGCEPFEL